MRSTENFTDELPGACGLACATAPAWIGSLMFPEELMLRVGKTGVVAVIIIEDPADAS